MHKQLDRNDNCKAKNLKWVGMHWCLPFLKNRRELVFLSFMNVDPQKLKLDLLDRHHHQPRVECNARHKD
jgi:hypothetical protein